MSRSPQRRVSPRLAGPRLVAAGELVPGDLLALSARDVAARRWYVVVDSCALPGRSGPEPSGLRRVTLRPPLGGAEREEVFDAEWGVIVDGRRRAVADGIPRAV
ncbi:hypothetical protein GCM10010145_08990 [Streptomyces ruber]|uniref:Uncharacterized protein n=2 Tax=Streptomyces TaxID=1883 RepID=A0A918B7Y6_9ACTN|nr:hypothetical protein [Streptomyces ruber]GGQ42400.1 hypothetical protein GCM10010145_08990 [Streptomyces ruber]